MALESARMAGRTTNSSNWRAHRSSVDFQQRALLSPAPVAVTVCQYHATTATAALSRSVPAYKCRADGIRGAGANSRGADDAAMRARGSAVRPDRGTATQHSRPSPLSGISIV